MQGEKTTGLDSLLDMFDIVILPKVGPGFCVMGLHSTLCEIYQKSGHDAVVLEVW